VRTLLEARRQGVAEQLAELGALRGKNQDVIEHIMTRVNTQKAGFERGLQRFAALRSVFTQETNALLDLIGRDALRDNAARTRRSIEDSAFTTGMRAAYERVLRLDPPRLRGCRPSTSEVHDMMQAMYLRFASEAGPRALPASAAVDAQVPEGVRPARARVQPAFQHAVEHGQQGQVRAAEALLRDDRVPGAARLRHRESGRRGLAQGGDVPLETQVREHHMQLKRRLESVRRIHRASGELDERIDELEQQDEALRAQLAALEAKCGPSTR